MARVVRPRGSSNAARAEREWLASLSAADKQSIPKAEPGKDRAAIAERRQLAADRFEQQKLEGERMRDSARKNTRSLRRVPKGLKVVTASHEDKTIIGVVAAEPEIPRALSPGEVAAAERLLLVLSCALKYGHATDADAATLARAHDAAFGPYALAWVGVVLDTLTEARALEVRLRLKKGHTMSPSERAVARWTLTAKGLHRWLLRRLSPFPGVVLPTHIDPAVLRRALDRFGVEGAGGRLARIGRKQLEKALPHPSKLRALVG